MKQLIVQENRRQGLVNNIKLGEGGIREVEFIVQAFQLIRGGREPELRTRSTREALIKLQVLDEMSAEEIAVLTNAYYFLRKTEHVLQQIADKQTQTLPEDEIEQQRLIHLFKQTNWQQFLALNACSLISLPSPGITRTRWVSCSLTLLSCIDAIESSRTRSSLIPATLFV